MTDRRFPWGKFRVSVGRLRRPDDDRRKPTCDGWPCGRPGDDGWSSSASPCPWPCSKPCDDGDGRRAWSQPPWPRSSDADGRSSASPGPSSRSSASQSSASSRPSSRCDEQSCASPPSYDDEPGASWPSSQSYATLSSWQPFSISLACPTIERSPTASTLRPYNRTFLANYYQNQEMSSDFPTMHVAGHVEDVGVVYPNRESICPLDIIQSTF